MAYIIGYIFVLSLTRKHKIRIMKNAATITTCFGETKVWKEVNRGTENVWIEYQNEHGFTTQEKVSCMKLRAYING